MTIFEDILAGRSSGEIVYQDDRVAVIMDIAPMNPGHCLVIPRTPSGCLADLDPADGERMFRVARIIANTLRAVIPECQGINLFLADGQAAGQEVMHVHLHVIPRLDGDGIRLHRVRTKSAEKPSQDSINQVAEILRARLAGDPCHG